jgi:hypothetical protein
LQQQQAHSHGLQEEQTFFLSDPPLVSSAVKVKKLTPRIASMPAILNAVFFIISSLLFL